MLLHRQRFNQKLWLWRKLKIWGMVLLSYFICISLLPPIYPFLSFLSLLYPYSISDCKTVLSLMSGSSKHFQCCREDPYQVTVSYHTIPYQVSVSNLFLFKPSLLRNSIYAWNLFSYFSASLIKKRGCNGCLILPIKQRWRKIMQKHFFLHPATLQVQFNYKISHRRHIKHFFSVCFRIVLCGTCHLFL